MAVLKSRNPEVIRGVNRYGRSKSSRHSYRFTKLGANNKSKYKPAEKKKRVGREKAWYNADDVKNPKFSRKSRHSPTKLRKNITPGTVLIVLAGRFRGKRVVFLKQLESGLLLVTGPFKINGVPLRRLNQRYVIATSTKLDISKVDSKSINDTLFAKPKQAHTKKEGEAFFEEKKEQKNPNTEARKSAQSGVDKAVLAIVKATPQLRQYLNAKFSLTNGQKPHELKF